MSNQDDQNIFTGTTLEEAIQAGLKALDLNKEDVEINVLEEGAKGLFGLGSKDAKVHIRPLGEMNAPSEDMETSSEDMDDDELWDDEPEDEFENELEMEMPAAGGRRMASDSEQLVDDELVQITKETVIELLEKMNVQANVETSMSPADTYSNRAAVSVNITGDDLSILIGRKAETLEALEYITRLIVGKEVNGSVIVNLDVQGYRERKEQKLRRIARTVAKQAVETGRVQYLEPMPASERRIIHIELRDHPDVYTESTGEGFRRKVTINPRI